MTILSIEFALIFLMFFCIYWGFSKYPLVQKVQMLVAGFAFIASFSPYFLLLSIPLSLGVMWVSSSKCSLVYKVSLILVLVPLLFFKYATWVSELVQKNLYFMGFSIDPLHVTWVVPLGISFYTFNLITYLVSKHKDMVSQADSPSVLESTSVIERYIDILLFTHFLPVIVSGPILRAENMWVQFRAKDRQIGNPSRILMLILMGLFKKLLLASYLNGSWMVGVFQNPAQYNSLELLMGVYAYAFEIYCDFSGYTDLVIAMGLLLGFEVPENFNSPYISTNLKEFWQRWHISLSEWIRDYIYIPLGGNRGGFWKAQLWVFIAMVLSGIWHGSGTPFLVWGILHALGLIIVKLYHRYMGYKLPVWLAQIITFNYVGLTWVYFRSPSLEQAYHFIYGVVTQSQNPVSQPVFYAVGAIILLYLTQQIWVELPNRLERFLSAQTVFKQALLFSILTWVIMTISPSGIPNFIYAQF